MFNEKIRSISIKTKDRGYVRTNVALDFININSNKKKSFCQNISSNEDMIISINNENSEPIRIFVNKNYLPKLFTLNKSNVDWLFDVFENQLVKGNKPNINDFDFNN